MHNFVCECLIYELLILYYNFISYALLFKIHLSYHYYDKFQDCLCQCEGFIFQIKFVKVLHKYHINIELLSIFELFLALSSSSTCAVFQLLRIPRPLSLACILCHLNLDPKLTIIISYIYKNTKGIKHCETMR